jgi:putative transposase
MTKPGHRKFRLFAHITWHTRYRERTVRREDTDTITRAIRAASDRNAVHVLALAVLSDHVHVVVSFRPDRSLTSFIRDAKSESARRVNTAREHLTWARGYYAGSLSHSHIAPARVYLARQHERHPDRILTEEPDPGAMPRGRAMRRIPHSNGGDCCGESLSGPVSQG